MTKITKQELREMLLNSPGTNIVTVLAATKPKVIKDAPFTNLMKFSQINGIIGFNYVNAVNNRRHKEGKEKTFTASERIWGECIGKSAVIHHNGLDYLEIKVEKSAGRFFADNDKIIPEEQVKPYLIDRKPTNQDLEKPVILRDIRFDNIRSIKIAGKEFEIK